MAQPASKVSQEGPKQAHLVPRLSTLEALLAFAHFYAFLSGFREHLCIFAENP